MYVASQSALVKTNVHARPLTESFTGAADWKYADGTQRWSDPGGEADRDLRPATAEVGGDPAAGGRLDPYWNVRRFVRDWVSGKKANHGLLLEDDGVGTDNYIEYYATESASQRPYLELEWQPRLGERRGYKFESLQLTDRISLKVNAGTGNLLVQQTDFSMPGGLGPDVAISRSYNSSFLSEGAFGQGWTLDHGHNVKIRQIDRFSALYTGPSGVQVGYELNDETNKWETPPGFNNTLEKNVPSSGKWQITDHGSQTKKIFRSDGTLEAIEDRNGRRVTADNWSHDAKVQYVKDAQNDTISFDYTGGPTRLTQMTDPASRTYGYAYNASGRLETYTDPQNGSANPTRYEYNGPQGRLSKITTPLGNITLVTYHSSGQDYGRVKTVTRVTDTTAMTGPTWTFDYKLRPDGSGQSWVTDPLGSASNDENDRMTRHEFDDQSRHTKTIDALGRETSRKLTSNSNVESYTAAGNTGTTPNTSLTYDSDDNATKSSTPAGSGNILGCADYGTPDSASERCDDPSGTYNGVTGVSGSQYLPGRATNPQGGRTNFSYTDGTASPADTNGNLHGIQQTTSNGTQVSNVSFSWGTGADGKKGRLNSITDGRSNTTTYGYDSKGNLNAITPPNPGSPNIVGSTTVSYHASLDRVENVKDGKDNYRVLRYDNLDRLVGIDFTGTNTTLDGGEPYVEYVLDRDGNQLEERTREQGTGTGTGASTRGTGTVRTRTMTYDKLNRVTYESLPGGASNTMTYDLVGNLRSLTDAGGKVEYTYDAVNQVRAIYEPGVAKPSRFSHNKDGQRDKTTYPNGVVIDQRYDSAQRLTEIESTKPGAATPLLQKLTYAYKDPTTNRETPLIWQKIDGKLGHAHEYVYDRLDRLMSATIKNSSTSSVLATYDYSPATPVDGSGNKVADLDRAGNVRKRVISGSQAPNSVTDYTYNQFNQLCAKASGTTSSVPSNTCPTSSPAYTYDKNGNQTAAPGRTGTYNLLDQTTNLTISGSPTSMLYLGAGQDRWSAEGSGALQHNVLGIGSRTVGASSDFFTRDEGGKLVSRRNGSTRHYYLFDALGSVTGLTDSTGAVTQRYDYDPYGAPAPSGAGQWAATSGAADVAQGQFGFAGGYRSVGGLYHFGQRYYDPADMRWTQADPLDQTGDLREGSAYLYAAADPIGMRDLRGTSIRDVIEDVGRQAVRTAVGGSASIAQAATALYDGAQAGSNFERSSKFSGSAWRQVRRVPGALAVGGYETVRQFVPGLNRALPKPPDSYDDVF
jgi:RHS repeat-associated protein